MTQNTTDFRFVLRKKKGRTIVTETWLGDYPTHPQQAIANVWGGFGHYWQARWWLHKNKIKWEKV